MKRPAQDMTNNDNPLPHNDDAWRGRRGAWCSSSASSIYVGLTWNVISFPGNLSVLLPWKKYHHDDFLPSLLLLPSCLSWFPSRNLIVCFLCPLHCIPLRDPSICCIISFSFPLTRNPCCLFLLSSSSCVVSLSFCVSRSFIDFSSCTFHCPFSSCFALNKRKSYLNIVSHANCISLFEYSLIFYDTKDPFLSLSMLSFWMRASFNYYFGWYILSRDGSFDCSLILFLFFGSIECIDENERKWMKGKRFLFLFIDFLSLFLPHILFNEDAENRVKGLKEEDSLFSIVFIEHSR